MRRLKTLVRVWIRAIVRYLTGRRWTVPLPDQRKVMEARVREFVAALTPEFYAKRRENNRDLLTGMIVALGFGHSQYLTGWERYKHASRTRSNYRREFATRIIGKPVVYSYKNTKIGVTEWHQDFVPRAEQLAARKRLRRVA